MSGSPSVGSVSSATRDVLAAWLMPALALLFHLLTYRQYGYFRDELYYLANGEHLGFGYVEHPPMIGLIAALVRTTLGDSLFAIRLLPAVVGALTVWFAAAIAREFGGGRFAQILAGLATFLAPAFLGIFGVFTMNSFDLFVWAVLWWLAARALATGRARLWLAFGIVAGIGLENKISVLFLGFGIVVGLVVNGTAIDLRGQRGAYADGVGQCRSGDSMEHATSRAPIEYARGGRIETSKASARATARSTRSLPAPEPTLHLAFEIGPGRISHAVACAALRRRPAPRLTRCPRSAVTPDFSARRRLRSAVLEALYRETDGDVATFVSLPDVTRPLGIEESELRRITAYLEERRWIVVDDHKTGIVRLTADGVDRVETGESD